MSRAALSIGATFGMLKGGARFQPSDLPLSVIHWRAALGWPMRRISIFKPSNAALANDLVQNVQKRARVRVRIKRPLIYDDRKNTQIFLTNSAIANLAGDI